MSTALDPDTGTTQVVLLGELAAGCAPPAVSDCQQPSHGYQRESVCVARTAAWPAETLGAASDRAPEAKRTEVARRISMEVSPEYVSLMHTV